MKTRLDLPLASEKAEVIHNEIQLNLPLKYLKIRPSDLPYAVGVLGGLIYLAINDAFFVFILSCFGLVFGAIYYIARTVPFLEKSIGHRISVWHLAAMVLGLTLVFNSFEPAHALFLDTLETKVSDIITASGSGIDAAIVTLVFNFIRVAFILFVVAAGIFAFVQAQQGNDPRPIIGTIVIAFGTIMGIDVLTRLIAGA